MSNKGCIFLQQKENPNFWSHLLCVIQSSHSFLFSYSNICICAVKILEWQPACLILYCYEKKGAFYFCSKYKFGRKEPKQRCIQFKLLFELEPQAVVSAVLSATTASRKIISWPSLQPPFPSPSFLPVALFFFSSFPRATCFVAGRVFLVWIRMGEWSGVKSKVFLETSQGDITNWYKLNLPRCWHYRSTTILQWPNGTCLWSKGLEGCLGNQM